MNVEDKANEVRFNGASLQDVHTAQRMLKETEQIFERYMNEDAMVELRSRTASIWRLCDAVETALVIEALVEVTEAEGETE